MGWTKNMENNREIIFSTAANSFHFNSDHSPHHRRCIDGRITGCGNCVGYCNFRDHPGYLTKDLRKKHDCIKKGCNYYVSKTKPAPSVSPFAVLAALI